LDFGGHSSLSFAFVDPANTNIVVAMAATTDGQGYWTVRPSGVVQAKGHVLSGEPSGQGCWLVTGDGGILTYCSAAEAGGRTVSPTLPKPAPGLR
jgi:hypothetical protein